MAATPDKIKAGGEKKTKAEEPEGMTAAQRAEHDAKTGYQPGGVHPVRPDGTGQYRETKGSEFAAETPPPPPYSPTTEELMKTPGRAGELLGVPGAGPAFQAPLGTTPGVDAPLHPGGVSRRGAGREDKPAESIRFVVLGRVLDERVYQDGRWGAEHDAAHTDAEWNAILVVLIAGAAAAQLDGDESEVQNAWREIAATAIAAMEAKER